MSEIITGSVPEGMEVFHGGCLGCESHMLYGKGRCVGCMYFDVAGRGWGNYPNLSTAEAAREARTDAMRQEFRALAGNPRDKITPWYKKFIEFIKRNA